MDVNFRMLRTFLQVHALDLEWVAVARRTLGLLRLLSGSFLRTSEGMESWAKCVVASAASVSVTGGALRDSNAYHLGREGSWGPT